MTTNPLTIIILRDPDNPYQPTGFLFDGSSETPINSGDWQTTVTGLFWPPGELHGTPGSRYRLLVVIYPKTSAAGFPAYLDTGVPVYYVLQRHWGQDLLKHSDYDKSTAATSTANVSRWTVMERCAMRLPLRSTVEWSAVLTLPLPYNWWDCHYWWRGQWGWWCDWHWPWITQEPFDFTLNATPGQQTVKAGQSVTFTVAATLVSGTSQLVTLTLPNPPAGVSYSFGLASGNPDFTSALKVTVDATVPVGTQVLTITGTGGGKTHSTTINIDVASNKAESSLSISINPAALKVGESVSVGGALTPSLTTSIELVYTRPDGFEMIKHVTITGAFSDTFNPDMSGSWSVKARWSGDSDHYGSESQQAGFMVEAAPEAPPSFWGHHRRTKYTNCSNRHHHSHYCATETSHKGICPRSD